MQIFLEFYVFLLTFEQDPDKDQLLIKVLGGLEDFDSGPLFSLDTVHIKDIGNESIGNLPGRIDLYEVSNVIIDRRQNLILDWGLILFEGFARKYLLILLLLRFILLKLIEVYFTHFSLHLSLDIRSFLEFLKTIFKFNVIAVSGWDLLICLYFLFSKYLTELLSYHHQWLKGFFYSFCNPLDEGVIGKYVLGFGNITRLEHLLPNLV